MKSLIAGNWKMNKNLDEAIELIQELRDIEIKDGREVLICPPFISLNQASKLLEDSEIFLGAQNFYYEDSGAYTGEISADMLASVGVSHVIVGHSERRELFNETEDLVNKKVKNALDHGLKPILCVGETEDERSNNQHFAKIKSQLVQNLDGIDEDQAENIIIAYEPIWAIGTGKTASAHDAEEMCSYIRQIIEDLFGTKISQETQILYGGSVKPDSISQLMSKSDINGALVGGASLNGKDFEQIINYE